MSRNTHPLSLTGALVGGLLMVALVAVLFVAAQLAGAPFPPFDLFDWLARVLPGDIIRLGINLIVSVIAALNLEDTSRAAKTAEHLLAVGMLIGAGIAAGAAAFVLFRRQTPDRRLAAGLLLGAALGGGLLLMRFSLGDAAAADTAGPAGALWTLAAFLAWGAALAWVYNRLMTLAPLPLTEGEGLAASAQAINRRQFLVRLGGATATITVVGAGVGVLLNRTPDTETVEAEDSPPAWSDSNPLPNAGDSVMPAPGTRAELTPVSSHYRIDINSLPVVLREADWTLSITGLVDNPLELTLAELQSRYQPLHQFVTLSCISNSVGGDLIGTQRWTGVPLRDILADAGPQVAGGYLRIRGADGFDETLPLADARADERIMLAYDWDGLPLTTAHGYPLRIYIPNVYGMKQPKWIVSIEVTERYEDGYWVRRSWDEVARVQATAVVDTVATGDIIEDGDRRLVPVGGIAYAGARGISAVEVRVDDGDWQPAALRAPLSGTTWVLWRYDWPFEAGQHTFQVRCADGLGVPQIETSQNPFPSGATGLHRRRANL